MTSGVHNSLSLPSSPDAVVRLSDAGSSSTSAANDKKRLAEASRQFEAIFLRQMLACLERTTSVDGKNVGGSALYGSMLVDAVADSVTRAGGIGLGSLLVKSLQPQTALVPHVVGSVDPTDKATPQQSNQTTDTPSGLKAKSAASATGQEP